MPYKLPRIQKKYWDKVITPYTYLRKLKPAKGYKYDQEEGEKVINWIESNCYFSSNEWEKQPFVLYDWQKLMLSKFYGFVKTQKVGNKTIKVRQFRDLFLFIPKKNGKTELASALMLYHLLASDEPDPKIFSIAVTEKQSALVYDKAKKMLEFNPTWKDEVDIYKTIRVLVRPMVIRNKENSGEFRVLTSRAIGTQGISPSLVIADELHEAQDTYLFDSVASPYAAAARRQPVNLLFTTAGYDVSGLVQIFLARAKGIMSGKIKDHRFMPVIFQALEFNLETAISLAKIVNPGYSTGLMNHEYFVDGLNFAKMSPDRMEEFTAYVLNILREKDKIHSFIPLEKFQQCQVDSQRKSIYIKQVLKKYTSVGAVDFGSKSDFTSFVVIAYNPTDEKYYMRVHTWVTTEEQKEQIRRKIPFDKWKEKGYFEPDVIDVFNPDLLPKLLERTVRKNKYNLVELRYDPAWIQGQMERLNKTPLFFEKCVPAKVTMTGLNEAHNKFLGHVLDNQIVFEKNELLDWCSQNCYTRTHPQGYKHIEKFHGKDKKAKKIDPIMAMILGFDSILKQEQTYKQPLTIKTNTINPIFKGEN